MSTNQKPSSKSYDPEFKKQAVQLLHTSGRLQSAFRCRQSKLVMRTGLDEIC